MQRIPLDHPIIVIGAGGIVRDAHLPAYSKAGFRLAGIYDLEVQKAKPLADQYGIPRVFATLDDAAAAATPDTVFDVAVPAAFTSDVLRALPDGHGVLIQKPRSEGRLSRRMCCVRFRMAMAY